MKAIQTRTYIGLMGLIIALILINVVSNQIFRGVRIDLTQEKLYSLTKGSKDIVRSLKDPITIKYYFSATDTSEIPSINNYGNNVLDLLRSYARLSSNLKLEIYDPRPDTEEAEWAEKYGIQGIQVLTGDSIYCGLVITNQMDNEEVISFLDPKREEFLEYDISKALSAVANRNKPVIGVFSSLNLQGMPAAPQMPGQNSEANQPWFFTNDLDQMYDVKYLDSLETIPAEVNLLLLIHPKNLDEKSQQAIDQYLLEGKSAVIFVDPLCENDIPQNNPQNPMMAMAHKRSSDLPLTLVEAGINIKSDKIILDAKRSTKVQTAPGQLTDYYPWLSLISQDVNREDVVTGQLENLLFPTAGIISINKEKAKDLKIVPLITSSPTACEGDSSLLMFGGTPQSITKAYQAGSGEISIAVRITGNISSFIKDTKQEDSKLLTKSSKPLNVIIVSDVDFIANRFALNVANFFGNLLVSPINDNMNFLFNAVESLTGAVNLTDIRSRGKFTRPFTKVLEIEARAEKKWKQEEDLLVAKVEEANTKIQSLMGSEEQKNNISNKAILEEVKKFKNQKIETQKKLRAVRKSLRQEKEMLGTQCFLFNTFLVPIIFLFYGIYLLLTPKKQRV